MKVQITCVVSETREIDLQDAEALEQYNLEPGASKEDVIEAIEEEINDNAEEWTAEHAGLVTVEEIKE